MFKLFFLACMLALAAAEPKPEPSVVFTSYPAVSAPLVAAVEPVPAAYPAPLTYSAYPAPLAYSAYSYGSGFPYFAFRR